MTTIEATVDTALPVRRVTPVVITVLSGTD
jgi:hypothetical protein